MSRITTGPRRCDGWRTGAVDYADFDLAILLTDHDDIDYDGLQDGPLPVFDTRNRLTGDNVERL